MNYSLEARNIIYQHTEAFISGINFECKDNHTLYDRMVAECAFILTEKLLDGTYTPMQYNAIRNELAKMLWNVFEKYINEEMQ